MSARGWVWVGCAIAAGAIAIWWSAGSSGPAPAPTPTATPMGSHPPESQPRGESSPQPATSAVVPPEAPLEASGTLPDESIGQPAMLPGRAVLRVEPKLAPEAMSEVPHQLLGAWDEAPDSPRPGAHRTFVAIVDPGVSRGQLQTLLVDVSQRHRDAQVLDVRVYDSAEAATLPASLTGNREQRVHLVAKLVRNDRLDYEAMEIRGEPVAH